jgi:hypothetical protein
LTKLFEEVKAKGDKTMRYTRTEKKKEEERKMNEAIDAAMEEEDKKEEDVPAIDPLEFAPEVDIASKFDGAWQDKTAELKKWNEKVDKFNEVVDACKNVKIKPGQFGSLYAFFKKEIKAVNVNTSCAAIKAAGAIGKGIKKGTFTECAKEVLPEILNKYKEKKQNVIDEVNGFMDVLLTQCSIEDIKDELLAAICHVAPGVKSNTIVYVEKFILITYIDVLKRVF